MKEATVRSRLSSDLKEQAETVLNSIGMSSSEAIRLFYKQIAIRKKFQIRPRLKHSMISMKWFHWMKSGICLNERNFYF